MLKGRCCRLAALLLAALGVAEARLTVSESNGVRTVTSDALPAFRLFLPAAAAPGDLIRWCVLGNPAQSRVAVESVSVFGEACASSRIDGFRLKVEALGETGAVTLAGGPPPSLPRYLLAGDSVACRRTNPAPFGYNNEPGVVAASSLAVVWRPLAAAPLQYPGCPAGVAVLAVEVSAEGNILRIGLKGIAADPVSVNLETGIPEIATFNGGQPSLKLTLSRESPTAALPFVAHSDSALVPERWLRLGIAALPASEAAAGAAAIRQSEAAASAAIDRWITRSRVQIEPDAKTRILQSFLESLPLIATFSQTSQAAADELKTQLVAHYCFDLRDSHIESAGPPPAVPRVMFRFQAPSQQIVIREPDTERLSFREEVTRILGGLLSGNPHPAVGYARIESIPPMATIRIDNSVEGYTDRSFVLSEGAHAARIGAVQPALECRVNFVIRPGELSTLHCPK
jgi:hypothetical protein